MWGSYIDPGSIWNYMTPFMRHELWRDSIPSHNFFTWVMYIFEKLKIGSNQLDSTRPKICDLDLTRLATLTCMACSNPAPKLQLLYRLQCRRIPCELLLINIGSTDSNKLRCAICPPFLSYWFLHPLHIDMLSCWCITIYTEHFNRFNQPAFEVYSLLSSHTRRLPYHSTDNVFVQCVYPVWVKYVWFAHACKKQRLVGYQELSSLSYRLNNATFLRNV